MKMVVVGAGYVGLVTAAGFADLGNHVTCVDVDHRRVERLRKGKLPFHEPCLRELVEGGLESGRLAFTADLGEAVRGARVAFVAVGTPPNEDGSADLSAVDAVAHQVRESATDELVLVLKSTVPVGTHARIRALVAEARAPIHVASNPEFLREGSAVDDFLRPDRIVIGTAPEDTCSKRVLGQLYAPLDRDGDRIQWMDPASAELTKYVANTMLAMRISFMNEVALLCERVGADVQMVRRGVSSDPRIGSHFLYPGPGYGGSCLLGDETVLVRHGDRERLVRLDRLFEEIADPSDIPEAVAIVLDGFEVLAWNPEGSRFERCAVLTRRPYEGDVHEVRTKMGRSVRCTADHPFVVVDPDTGVCDIVLANELTRDHWLPLSTTRPVTAASPGALDVVEVLAETEIQPKEVILRLADRDADALRSMNREEIFRRIGHLGHPRGRERVYDMVRTATVRLDEARQLELSLEGATLGTARNGTYVPGRIALDEEFWRIVGLYLAEGHRSVDGRRHRLTWSFHPTDEQPLVEEVSAYFARLGIKHDVRRGTTSMQVSVSSRILAALFVDVLSLGGDCYSHRLPDLAWTAPEEHRWALLSGLWHGDGSWSRINGGPSVVLEYGTVSPLLADGMLRMLAELGVVARTKSYRVSKSTRDAHFLIVSGADQIERSIRLVKPSARDVVLASVAQQQKRIAPTGYRSIGQGTGSSSEVAVRVVGTEASPFQGFVYSLEVAGAHTVVTRGGLVVHNCFPKDVRALVATARAHDLPLHLALGTHEANERQKGVLLAKLRRAFQGKLRGRRIGIWGATFKPDTDDLREAPALALIDGLLADGAAVAVHDPSAGRSLRQRFGDRIEVCNDEYQAITGADALVLVTEWRQYRSPDFDRVRALLRQPVVIDGRNIWPGAVLRDQGFRYEGIGVRA